MKISIYNSLVNISTKMVVTLIGILSTGMAATADVNYGGQLPSLDSQQMRKQAQYIPVDYTTIQITDYKLAVMHVLYEICPSLINYDRRTAFEKSFSKKINDMMPEENNPRQVLEQLSTEKNYKKIFASMKQQTINNFSNDENKALCEDFIKDEL